MKASNNRPIGKGFNAEGGHSSSRGRRPRLLFLAWHFPPANAVACIRTWNIAKHLSRLGWDIRVVTPDPSLWQHVDDPKRTEEDLRQEGIIRITTGHHLAYLEPEHLKCAKRGIGRLYGGVIRKTARSLGLDKGVGWLSAARRACSHMGPDDVDLILASGPPFASFTLAQQLSQKLRRPYVLDYRDPWTAFPHSAHPARPATVRQERGLIQSSSAVTVVTPSWASVLNRDFGVGEKLHVITNGYDADELSQVQPCAFGHSAIVYTGIFYPPKRVISPVMAALQRLKATGNGRIPKWYFHYYGPHEEHFRREAERFGIQDSVVLHGRVSRSEALSAVRGASVAVVITSVFEQASLEDKGIMTGKIFDAVGLETPTLLIAPQGSDIELLVDAGVACRFSGNEISGMASYLADVLAGNRVCCGNPASYGWNHLAGKLDVVLRGVVQTRSDLTDQQALKSGELSLKGISTL